MNRNSNGMSTGMALLCTLGILLFIGWMIDLGTPKCNKSGCDNDAKEGSSYCYLHDNSTYRYKSSTSYSGSSKSSGSPQQQRIAILLRAQRAVARLQTARKLIHPAVVLQRRIKVLWIPMMMATMRYMRTMITTGIAIRAMMTMLPVWMMPWKMRTGKLRRETHG